MCAMIMIITQSIFIILFFSVCFLLLTPTTKAFNLVVKGKMMRRSTSVSKRFKKVNISHSEPIIKTISIKEFVLDQTLKKIILPTDFRGYIDWKDKEKYCVANRFSDEFDEKTEIKSRKSMDLVKFFNTLAENAIRERCYVVVPFERLKSLLDKSPRIKIQSFEHVLDFWGYHREIRVPTTEIYDLTNDNELWDKLESIDMSKIEKTVEIHVIVNFKRRAASLDLTAGLAASSWNCHNSFYLYHWGREKRLCEVEGKMKRKKTPYENPKVYLPAFYLPSHSPIDTDDLPATGGLTKEKLQLLETTAKMIRESLIQLQQPPFNGLGWFCGTPEIFIVIDKMCAAEIESGVEEENELVEPGTERDYALPCSSKRLLGWIEDGSIESGRVVLFQSRRDPYRYFVPSIKSTDFRKEELKSLQPRPEVIVFWCNNASRRSWMRTMFDYIKDPKNGIDFPVQCLLLESGIYGFEDYMESLGRANELTEESEKHFQRIREEKERKKVKREPDSTD